MPCCGSWLLQWSNSCTHVHVHVYMCVLMQMQNYTHVHRFQVGGKPLVLPRDFWGIDGGKGNQ